MGKSLIDKLENHRDSREEFLNKFQEDYLNKRHDRICRRIEKFSEECIKFLEDCLKVFLKWTNFR